ncbi:Peroxisomal leader peptide-processing protease [Mactra antiquata]
MNTSWMENPYNRLCAVSAKLPAGDSYLEGSTSGTLIDAKNGHVITHASLLYPFTEKFRPENFKELLSSGYVNQSLVSNLLKIDVYLPNSSHGDGEISVNDKLIHPVEVLSQNAQEISSHVKYSAKLKSVFVCKKLKDTLHKMTPKESWKITEDLSISSSAEEVLADKRLNTKKEEMCYQLLSCFVVLKLKEFHSIESTMSTLSFKSSVDNRSGDTVEICATPFGTMSPDVFLNSVSRGIISKLAGPQNVLIFTDARCVPGSEGGGLFYCHRGKRFLTGIVIASLCWKANEWVGLSMACSINEVLGSLSSHFIHDIDLNKKLDSTYLPGYENGFISRMVDNVVYVTVGASWGSGIIINKSHGVILTCSHVLKGVDYRGVCVSNAMTREELQCSVLFRSPLKSHFDIALIKTTNLQDFHNEMTDLTFGQVTEGEVVYVIGHAIFRGNDSQSPMITRGIVSKIVKYKGVPVLLQTTCAVHAGASGGGVFNTRGELVAMVVCNSRDTLSGASYPHVNMCVPIETVSSIFKQYLKTHDSSILSSLHVKSEGVSRLWSIGTEDSMACSKL